MFCGKCGHEIKDGEKFCMVCGTKTEEIAQMGFQKAPSLTDEPSASAKPDVTSAETAPEAPAAISIGGTPDAPVAKKTNAGFALMRMGKKGLIAAIAGVLVVAIAITAVASPMVRNAFVKTVLSPEKYLQHVVKHEMEDVSSDVAKYIALFSESYDMEQAVGGNIEVTLGDGFESFIQAATGEDISEYTNWLNQMAIGYDVVMEQDKSAVDLDLHVNGADVISSQIVADMENNQLYLSVPELNAQPIGFSGADAGMQSYGVSNNAMDLITEVASVVPDEKVMKKMLNRYIACVIEQVDDVDEDSASFKIDGLTQKCTQLSVDLDEKLAVSIAKAVLKEAKDDKEIKAIIDDLEDIDELGINGLSSQFDNAIDQALDGLPDAKPSGETIMTANIWVNNKGEIIGIGMEDEYNEAYLITAEKGKKYAVCAEYIRNGSSVMSIEGSGTVKGGKRSGDFYAKYGDMKLVKLTLKDVNTKLMEDGVFNGTLTIAPADGINGMLSLAGQDEIASLISNLKLVVKGSSESTEDTDNTLQLYQGDTLCASLRLTGKLKDDASVSVPDSYVDATNDEAITAWAKNIDRTTLVQKLKNAGVPSQWTSLLEMAMGSLDYTY